MRLTKFFGILFAHGLVLLGLLFLSTTLPSCKNLDAGDVVVAVPDPLPVRTALSWENTTEPKPFRKPWSDQLLTLVSERRAQFDKATDFNKFCPKYWTLSNEQQTVALAEILIAVIYYESSYSATARTKETTMGIDPITKQQVWSEGLLMLSYQDKQWAKWCEFDWSKDKDLIPTDSRKTILDPLINLRCGVPIFANQVEKKKVLAPETGYWAVMNTKNRYYKGPEIISRVKKNYPVCF